MATVPMQSQAGSRVSPASLQECYERGEHYTVLNAALRMLSGDPDNVELAFLAFRSYAATGLIGPALEMVSPGGGPLSLLPEFAAMREQLSIIPSGRIAWSSLQSRFDANASHLYRAHPALQAADAAFRAIPHTLELFRAIDGSLQLREAASGGPRRWLPDLANAKQLAASIKLPHDPRQNFCAPYVVVGDRFGALFGRVFEGTRKMLLTFSPRIYLLETDVRTFGAALYVAESVNELCDDRVTVLVGPDCVEALANLLRRETARGLPDFIVRAPSSAVATHDRLVKGLRELLAERGQEAHATISSLRSHYDALPNDHWRDRFAQRDRSPLRILGLTSRFTTVLRYSMRDLKAAFEQLGHDMRLLIEENDHDLLPPIRTTQAISEFKPDLIFTIDHLRREYEQAITKNVPFVCWIQDQLPHLVCREAGRSLGPLDFFIAPEMEPLVRKYNYPASQGLLWTMATNDRLYSHEPLPDRELADYRCDFSFVSNQSDPPLEFHRKRQAMLSSHPASVRLTEYLFEALSKQIATNPNAACGTVMPLINEAVRATGVAPGSPEQEDKLGRFYLQPLADLMFRQAALEWVADYSDRTGRTLHLYGNGWERNPRFARYARGVAKNGSELRAIYQASKINLQITCYGAIHQRLLDGLAAGGFFLIRRCPTDVMADALRQLLAAVDKYAFRPETDYRQEEVPELAAALTALADLFHEARPGPIICLPAWKLEYYRAYAAANFSRVAGAVFDRYGDVAFASAEQLERFADQYLDDAQQRKAIAATMQKTVMERFTYAALVKDLLGFITDRMNTV